MPQHPPEDRLARLRGSGPEQSYSARKITALTANPACDRRAVLDAAGIDKALLARRLGHEPRFGRSPFAIAREQGFQAQVTWGGWAELIRLMRQELAAPVEEAAVADLNEAAGRATPAARHRLTRGLIERIAAGHEERLILDHPVITLEVAGRTAYLEPDALTHRVGGLFYVVEIRSFTALDGQAEDPAAVAETARQAAVHILALRRAFTAAGLDPRQVAHEFLLVCPQDFTNRPYGRLLDVRQELDVIEFQLGRLRRAEDIASWLPRGSTLDVGCAVDGCGRLGDCGHPPRRADAELAASAAALDASYTPACLRFCEMARYCRDEAEATASPARLGTSVRGDLPGIDSTRLALAYLDGTAVPDPSQADAVALLRDAARLRALRAGGAA
ncbi:hypothetical protein RKE29_21000 [Streptomyces sp. B1866]|uniref:hypothetical protein n=1 Tax=Streptomyces sp. B1866 TaxID=3075431 RepID=UPI00288F5EA2|nr:hypothetical protein [Streptomyces sp. B1866]MDT3399093.1 hypothetical protein [Streptomyces sp. B1866]